ncbi:MAG: hypothetical protein E7268_04585 [Lachnospiraceae bacterium]|nr:hypothetical protein [Lachnospiraceae bacterium]
MTESQMLKEIYNDMQLMKDDMQLMKDDMQLMKDDMQLMKDDMQLMKSDIQSLKDEVQATNEVVQEMNGDLQFLKSEVRDLQLTLENETNRNILIIAEGHLDLNRKLDEALKAGSEKELMHLRVNVLENDMRMVKERIGIA